MKLIPLEVNFKKLKKQAGLSLVELIVSIGLFALAVLAIGSLYTIAQQSYSKFEIRNDLTQNGRIALDRISAELRQANDVVINFGETEDLASHDIMMEDGIDTSEVTYIHYYLEGSNLKRSCLAYYFPADPDAYINYFSVGVLGEPPNELVISDDEIAENVADIKFFGSDFVNLVIELEERGESFSLSSSVKSRND